jgi:1,4-dihydroxy-2-naphthoate octaprenyltransferase
MVDKERLRAWIRASRPPFYVATLIPLTIGWILGSKGGTWKPLLFLLVNLASFAVHMATNLMNDYFDYVQGADAGQAIGGSRVLQDGQISLDVLRKAIILLYGLATLVGMYIVIGLNLWAMFPMLVFSLFSSIFYVAPPIRYGYHGLGELLVGINMGPVMVAGTYWVFSGRLDWIPLFISIPVGFMVASILYYQSLPDMETDEAVGKRTIAVRLGRRAACAGLTLFWSVIYLWILTLIVAGILPWPALASFLTLPIFIKMVGIVRKTVQWVELDQHGKYVRRLYFFNGLIIILALLL